MKELAAQIINKTLHPFSQEDVEVLGEYKENQIVKVKIRGFKKPRSVSQLRLFWACCRTVAENTNDQHWDTADKVAFQVKVALQFLDNGYDSTSWL